MAGMAGGGVGSRSRPQPPTTRGDASPFSNGAADVILCAIRGEGQVKHHVVAQRWLSAGGAILAAFAAAAGLAETPVAPPARQDARPRQIPVEDFAAQPMIDRPALSPDGKKVLAFISINGKAQPGIHFLFGGEARLLPIAEKWDVRWVRWAGNDRVLMSLAQTVSYFGTDAEATRLILFDLKAKTSNAIGRKTAGLEGDDVLYVDPGGEWLLLSMQKSVYDYPSVFRVSLSDLSMQEVVKQRTDVWEWYADADGVVRAGVGVNDVGGGTYKWSMVYRQSGADKFRKVGSARVDDEEASLDLMRFARGSDEGYSLNNTETGRYALYRYNYATRQRGELLFESKTNDVSDYMTSGDGTRLEAVTYTEDRDRVAWFDPKMKAAQDEIDGALKDRENWIVSRTPDDETMLVWTGASHNPGQLYLYRPALGIMNKVAAVNPRLKPSELAPSRYVTYMARDGLTIPAYLTLPKGRPAKGLPLVILPHGGPYYVRDRADFDPEVQLLANRGYAVLQPNFRGSDGYGKAFYEKGEGQWGRAMQDDLDDGMDWLAHEGIIDPKRVCIAGGSYGGYAALWGATRNPERYRCAASFAGISDLKRQLNYQLDFGINRRYRKDWRRTVQGETKFDPRTVSPLYTIDLLTVPLLIAHGDADQRVPFAQSKLYVDALRKAGKTVEFQDYKGEGHGFSSAANQADWLRRLDAFLAKYNPPDARPPTPPAPSP
jgi:dipeptidyl aminopeptidase/acylaminoacyl peptidase